MRVRSARQRREGGEIIVFILVVLALLAGGGWILKINRDNREREARVFADEAARRIVLQHDEHFLDRNLSPEAQVRYPPSYRTRMLDYIREAGAADPQFSMKGEVLFTNHFFDPNGKFIAEFKCPAGPAYLEVHISHPGVMWVIDAINWTWQPPAPPPTPTPSPLLATPTASPVAKPTHSAKPKP